MRSILEELFYGNICPNNDCRSHDKETKQLMGYIADHHEEIHIVSAKSLHQSPILVIIRMNVVNHGKTA